MMFCFYRSKLRAVLPGKKRETGTKKKKKKAAIYEKEKRVGGDEGCVRAVRRTAVTEIAPGVFSFDVSFQLLRSRKILSTKMALRTTSVRIGRTAVGPVNIEISWPQKAL